MEILTIIFGWIFGILFFLGGGFCFVVYSLIILPKSISAYRMTKQLSDDAGRNMKIFRLRSIRENIRGNARRLLISFVILAQGLALINVVRKIQENPMAYTAQLLLIGSVFAGLLGKVTAMYGETKTSYTLLSLAVLGGGVGIYLAWGG